MEEVTKLLKYILNFVSLRLCERYYSGILRKSRRDRGIIPPESASAGMNFVKIC
jgi:hypothetical protein